MDDLNVFEQHFEDRLRAFASSGVGPVDSSTVAHAVAIGYPRSVRGGIALRWRGLTLDRRALTLALVVGLLVTLLGAGLLVGARLLLPPSPGNARVGLAFELDGDIYVADLDGTDPTRIVDGSPISDGSVLDPNAGCGAVRVNRGLVSPDGRLIAYRSEDDSCPGAVLISDLAGRLIASVPGWGWDIAWSPDGTRVATWIDGDGQKIGVYGLDGQRQAVLDGSRMCCGDYDPVWSPDGSASIIVKESGTSGPVWELPVDGGAPRPVPAEDPRMSMAYSLRTPAYSPDGTRAAFIVFHDESLLYGRYEVDGLSDSLVVAASDGTERQVLIDAEPGERIEGGWARGPLWSPTGDRIAYVVSRDHAYDADGYLIGSTHDLRVVDPETGRVTLLSTAPGTLEALGFSPEGDRILFGQADAEGVESLWSVNTDGTDARLLVRGTVVGGWVSLPTDVEGSSSP